MTDLRKEEISKMNLDELKKEIIEVRGAASNERIWMLGSFSNEEALMHHDNRQRLYVEAEYIQSLIDDIEKKKGDV